MPEPHEAVQRSARKLAALESLHRIRQSARVRVGVESMTAQSNRSSRFCLGSDQIRCVRSLYEKDFRHYVRGRVDCRSVRPDLGAPGIRSTWWQPDEQHHDLVHHWSDHGADRHLGCGSQLAETLVEIVLRISATAKSTVCQPVAPSGTVPGRPPRWGFPHWLWGFPYVRGGARLRRRDRTV
jgi:hypothetical protein